MLRVVLVSFALSALPLSAAEPSVHFKLGPIVPKGGRLELSSETKPAEKPIVVTDFTGKTKLPHEGPYTVKFTPKGGLSIVAKSKWLAEDDKTLSLSDCLGSLVLRGDDLPRASAIVATATTDPGPGEKGHIAVQKASDYKEDMILPAGTYAVWVVPANGAKAQRVVENIRVLAGREVKQ